MKKYILALIANILLVLAISNRMVRSDTDAAVSGSPRFTYVCPSVWDECASGMLRADEELGTDTRCIGSSTLDADVQAAAIRTAEFSKVKGIITGGLRESSDLTQSINEAVAGGIPVVMAGTDLEDTDRTCYIGTNHREDGAQAGRDIAEACRTSGQTAEAAVIVPDLQNINQKECVEGFRSALADNPDIEISLELECGFDQISIQKLVKDMLENHPEINALFCTDISVSDIVGDVLKNTERDVPCTVVCCGLSDRVWEYISDGIYYAAVTQDGADIGYRSVSFLWDYLSGKRRDIDVIYTDAVDVRADFDYETWKEQQESLEAEWDVQ